MPSERLGQGSLRAKLQCSRAPAWLYPTQRGIILVRPRIMGARRGFRPRVPRIPAGQHLFGTSKQKPRDIS